MREKADRPSIELCSDHCTVRDALVIGLRFGLSYNLNYNLSTAFIKFLDDVASEIRVPTQK